MSKNINKNINKADLEKNRKIVLDFIGEEDKKKNTRAIEVKKIVVPDIINAKEPPKKKMANEEDIKKAKASLGLDEKENKEEKKKRTNPLVDKKISEEKPLDENIFVKKPEVKKSFIKKRKSNKKLISEKNKRQKTKKEIFESVKRVKSIKEKIKKDKAVSINNKNSKKINFNIFNRLFFIVILIIGVSLILAYLLYSFLVLNFNNKYLNNFSELIPVPAVISKFGCLDYNSVELIKNKEGDYWENVAIAMALKNLAEKKEVDYRGDIKNLKQILIDKKVMDSDKLEDYLQERINELRIWFLN